ncbi:hypothetical protein FRC20_011060, partial [Serendipita sp. 405]
VYEDVSRLYAASLEERRKRDCRWRRQTSRLTGGFSQFGALLAALQLNSMVPSVSSDRPGNAIDGSKR